MPKRKQRPTPVEGWIDPDDPMGSIERLHPDRIVSFGMWHKHRTGYRDTPQMCVSNRKWTDEWWVEVYGPEGLPDYFVLDANDHIHGRFGKVPPIEPILGQIAPAVDPDALHIVPVPRKKRAEIIHWKLFSQMMINPEQERSSWGYNRRETYDKKSTWHYLTAFFESTPTVLYLHIWPSEIRKFFAHVRFEAGKNERNARAALVH